MVQGLGVHHVRALDLDRERVVLRRGDEGRDGDGVELTDCV